MAAKKTNKELEEKYDSGESRLSQERSDFLLPQIVDFVQKHKWMNLHPEYQRRIVWDIKKRSLFMESLLMNVPIPAVFLFEWEYNRYEVMDGRQRLSAVTDFYDNKYSLRGLKKWSDLNGRTYSELPLKIQRGLDRRRISATVLLAENMSPDGSEDIRRLVFERLNTGGQNLNAHELRNCLYSGLFNDLLVRLAGLPEFNDAWEIPRYEDHINGDHVEDVLANHPSYKRMHDCEIVLRFFALRKKSNIKGSMRAILDRCMQDNVGLVETEIDKLYACFVSRLDLCLAVFGDKAFRLRDTKGKWRPSEPLYDAQMIAIDRLFKYRDQLLEAAPSIRRHLLLKLKDADFYELMVARANTAETVKKRLDEVEALLEAQI